MKFALVGLEVERWVVFGKHFNNHFNIISKYSRRVKMEGMRWTISINILAVILPTCESTVQPSRISYSQD